MIDLLHATKVSILDEIELMFLDSAVLTSKTIVSKKFEIIVCIKFKYLKKRVEACEKTLSTIIALHAVTMVEIVKWIVGAVLLSDIVSKLRRNESSGMHISNVDLLSSRAFSEMASFFIFPMVRLLLRLYKVAYMERIVIVISRKAYTSFIVYVASNTTHSLTSC